MPLKSAFCIENSIIHCISYASLAGLITLNATAVHAAAPLQTSRLIYFNVPAQSLESALHLMAQQAGVRLTYDSKVLPNVTSRSLNGELSLERGITYLLEGHPLAWKKLPNDTIFISAKKPPIDHIDKTVKLDTSLVLGRHEEPNSLHYDRTHLTSAPVKQGQITEVLRQHPAVQFDRNSLSSKSPADLAPSNISINGAKYWDNNFSVDGVSINNDINPGGREVKANSSFTDIPSNTSQGLNLDVNLLEGITVYDSNVPAEYGGFTGGMIDAKTRSPSKKLSGQASVSLTKNSWTKYHIDKRYNDDFFNPSTANGLAETQPEFRTLIYRTTLEGPVSENFGLIGSFVRKQSDIYNQNIYSKDMVNNGVTARSSTDLAQVVDNVFIKGTWKASDQLTIDSSLNYAPQTAEYFNINTLNGGFKMKSGGLQALVNAAWTGDIGQFEHKLGWSHLQQSRIKGEDYFKAWYYSEDKNWSDPTVRWNASMEGSYGNIEQNQKRLNYDFKLTLLPIHIGKATHEVKLGLAYDDTKASYTRDKLFTQANGTDLVPTINCTTAAGRLDSEYCSSSPVLTSPFTPWQQDAGQMFKRLYYYMPGDIELKQQQLAMFVDDNITWKNINLRPGLRLERDSFMRQLNLAPRLSLNWDVFGDKSTQLIAGANRYYGRSIFDYRLREGREKLRYVSFRDNDTLEFGERTQASKNTTNLKKLKTPYDNEITFGIEQVAFNTVFALRYVNRSGHDQIHRRPITNDGSRPDLSTTYYTYSNDGHSKSSHYYLSISPLHSLNFLGSQTQGELLLSWSDVKSSNKSYDDDFDDSLVIYKGRPIKAYEIPVDNFNRPWSARLITNTHIPQANLNISNFINWRADYTQVIRDGRVMHNNNSVYNYTQKRIGSALTWDTRVAWELPITRNETAFVNLDIGNLLNRRNMIGSSSSTNTNAETHYELGRNYTLEVGFRF